MRQRLYNPAQLSPDELKASFIARRETLEELLRVIRDEKPGRPCQHFLLIGPRGMGKTTLGLRLLLSLKDDSELAASWQPVAFDEESYGIGDLADFWLTALDHLARATDESRWSDRADALRVDESDPERQAVYARAALRDFCQESGKRLVLFVENLDVIFGQLGGELEVHTLRASLIERSDILLVGSANTVFEAIRAHGEPFYEFFRLFMLEGLGAEDTQRMLASFADENGDAELPEALVRERGRLETVRRLTGGNPRLLVLACRMLLESPLGSPIEDLERLIDEQTPYFKARIEELPVQGRRVFHCLAAGWNPMLAKEVAADAKLSSSHASAQLRQLVEKGYARELKLPREKRVRYEVSDRFYNIYYLLRFSRTGRHRLERLVHFLHDLFGPTGMRAMYPAALEVLREHELPAGDMSDLLGTLARFVASDTGYEGREDWRQHAMDLINKVIGAEAPVLKEIELAFAGQHPPEYRDFLDKLRNGIEMLEGERYEDAEALYREAIPEAPADVRAWYGLGVSLFLQERFEDCLAHFERLVEHVRPSDPEELRNKVITASSFKALAYSRLKRSEDAFPYLDLIRQYLKPDSPGYVREAAALSCLEAGRALATNNLHEEAIATWELATHRARADDPPELRHLASQALEEKGDLLFKLQRFDEALSAWERVSQILQMEDPEELRLTALGVLAKRGMTLLEQNRHEECATDLRLAAEYVRSDDPIEIRHATSLLMGASDRLLSRMESYRESEAACRKAAELNPRSGEAWMSLAETILEQEDDNRLPEVEECLRRAVGLEPENALALHMLSDAMARRGNWAEAMSLLERALDTRQSEFQTQDRPGLTESLIRIVAAGHGPGVKELMEKAGLAESMEPLWHAVRAELGEELGPLPAEIMDAVTGIRKMFAGKQ